LARHARKIPRRRLPPEQRRQELLDAGERIIRSKGCDARVEDIVEAANAAKGTFYVYFATWEAFLLELRNRVFQNLDERFERYRGECTDWVELMGGLPALFIDMTLSLEGLHQAVFHGPVEHVGINNSRLNVRSHLAEMIAEGIEHKALNTGDVATTTQFLFALLHKAADLAEAGHDRHQVAITLRQFLLQAFQVKRVRLRNSVSQRSGPAAGRLS
jgi:AcrR family transcriptional regulator